MKKLIYAFAIALVSVFAYAVAPTQAASLSPVTQGDTVSQTAADLRQEVGRRGGRGGFRGGRGYGRGFRGRGYGYRRGYRRGWRGPRFYFYAPYYGRRCWYRYGRRYCRY